VSERLIAEALYPYPPEVVIATKSRRRGARSLASARGRAIARDPVAGGARVAAPEIARDASHSRHVARPPPRRQHHGRALELSDQDFQELERG